MKIRVPLAKFVTSNHAILVARNAERPLDGAPKPTDIGIELPYEFPRRHYS
jgi:hypothetical protein